MEYNVSLYCVCVLLCLGVSVTDATVPEYFVDEHCSQTLSLNYGSVEALRLRLTKTLTYPGGMRCAMRIQAPEGKKLVVRIEKIDIMGTQDSLCQDGDFLQIFDGPSESAISHPDLPSNLCSKPEVGHFSTSGRFLVLRFISNTDLLTGSGLKLTITAYSETPCAADEFRCKTSAHCIKSSLRCNQQPSCPDGTDEAMPDCLSTAAIAGIIVGCVLVFASVVIAIVVLCVVRERRKRARIIKMNYYNGVTKISKPIINSCQAGRSTKVKSNTDDMSTKQNGRSNLDNTQNKSSSSTSYGNSKHGTSSSATLPRRQTTMTDASPVKQGHTSKTLPRKGQIMSDTKRFGIVEFPDAFGKCSHLKQTIAEGHYSTSQGFCNDCFKMEPETLRQLQQAQLYEGAVSLTVSETSLETHNSQPLQDDEDEDIDVQETDSEFTDTYSDTHDECEELSNEIQNQTLDLSAFLSIEPGSSNGSISSQQGTSYQCLWNMSGPGGPRTSKPLKAGEFKVQYNKDTFEFATVRKESCL